MKSPALAVLRHELDRKKEILKSTNEAQAFLQQQLAREIEASECYAAEIRDLEAAIAREEAVIAEGPKA